MPQPRPSQSISEIQALEPRRLYAATMLGRTLTLTGTHKADTFAIGVNQHSGDLITVEVNGKSTNYSLSKIDSIVIDAGQGNDYVFIDNSNTRLNRTFTIDGSGGNDTLLGGGGKDRITGGAGNDSIRGANTADTLYGGSGRDTIDGGEGNDFIDGGSGNDVLTGGAGVDRIFGLSGNDTITANDGSADRVDGGSGTDTARTDTIDGIVSIEDLRR